MMKKSKDKNRKLKVMVAMSGGVDSSVAAALLKRAGFEVEGAFMRLWGTGRFAEKNAKRIARRLNIPLHVWRFEREFKKRIIGYFLKEHGAGRTPNPCMVCNKEIKFGLFLEKASALKADYVASGHYACLRRGRLFRAKDKDQSYFLCMLGPRQLRRVLFPVGNYPKSRVKKLAKRFKLAIPDKSESQEICFIDNTLNDFLAKHIKSKPGPIMVFREGSLKIPPQKPGHQGLAFYTVGQRKGIGLAGGPYWVLRKDLQKNALIVTKKEKDLLQKELLFKKANWISGRAPELPLRIRAKIRYGGKAASAVLWPGRVVFDRPQRAVTPGQAVVFYRGEELIGGAFIF